MKLFDRFLFQFCVGMFFGVTLWRADTLGIFILFAGFAIGIWMAR